MFHYAIGSTLRNSPTQPKQINQLLNRKRYLSGERLMREDQVAPRSLSGELLRLGRSSENLEERLARLLRRVASQLHAGLDHRPR